MCFPCTFLAAQEIAGTCVQGVGFPERFFMGYENQPAESDRVYGYFLCLLFQEKTPVYGYQEILFSPNILHIPP